MLHEKVNAYAHTFGATVVPTLHAECKRLAADVAWDYIGFDDAYASVMRLAKRRGANHLPKHLMAELEAMLCEAILKYIDSFMPAVTDRAVSPSVIERVLDEWATVSRAARAILPAPKPVPHPGDRSTVQ
jgi:hypothetical protein